MLRLTVLDRTLPFRIFSNLNFSKTKILKFYSYGKLFSEWMKTNDKHYGLDELKARFSTFLDNHNRVEDLNGLY